MDCGSWSIRCSKRFIIAYSSRPEFLPSLRICYILQSIFQITPHSLVTPVWWNRPSLPVLTSTKLRASLNIQPSASPAHHRSNTLSKHWDSGWKSHASRNWNISTYRQAQFRNTLDQRGPRTLLRDEEGKPSPGVTGLCKLHSLHSLHPSVSVLRSVRRELRCCIHW